MVDDDDEYDEMSKPLSKFNSFTSLPERLSCVDGNRHAHLQPLSKCNFPLPSCPHDIPQNKSSFLAQSSWSSRPPLTLHFECIINGVVGLIGILLVCFDLPVILRGLIGVLP